jgi:hypothetical protein
MAIRVECCEGYRGVQEPIAFWLANRRLEVQALMDRWFAPGQYWFKVDADDGNIYILKYDETAGNWEIAAYRSGALR